MGGTERHPGAVAKVSGVSGSLHRNWSGVGLSMPAATYLRALLVILCVASLAYVATRPVGRLIALIFAAKK